MKELGIGLLGLGTVGSSVVELIQKHQESLEAQIGLPLVLKKIAVRDLKKNRSVEHLPKGILTTNIDEVVQHPDVHIVVELMGGVDQARRAVLDALEHEKQVVSANKALVAMHGEELFEAAQSKQRDFLFEAAVGGGIPILRVLRESYSGNRILSVSAIVNGTCNFILSELTRAAKQGDTNVDYPSVLKQAQEKGFAEADPTMDVDGTDSAQKLAILASLAFGVWIDYRKIPREGITELKPVDFEMADYFDYRIKLLAVAKEVGKGLEMRVHPTLLSKKFPLAHVEGEFNSIYIDGEPLGPSSFYGKGAGGGPTASAVVADIVDLGRNLMSSSAARVPVLPYSRRHLRHAPLLDDAQIEGRFYLRFSVVDRPGALGSIAQILGQNQIGISALLQKERGKAKPVPVVFLTHEAKEKHIQNALHAIDQLEVVVDRPLVMRIEE